MKWDKNKIIGMKFGRLTVKELVWNDRQKRNYALCVCDCGNEKEVNISNLRKGATVSCGCYRNERVRETNQTHGMYKSRLHKEWRGMKHRCKNPTASHFERYGGRGIKVCDEWEHSFEAFMNWSLKNGYDDTKEIDRINNDGDYEPDNCRWVTHKKNSENRHRKNNKTGVIGVVRRGNKYRAMITDNYKTIYLGTFDTIEEATEARRKLEKIYWK